MRKTTPFKIALIAFLGYFWMGINALHAQCPTVTQQLQSFCDVQEVIVGSLVAQDNGGGVVWYLQGQFTTPLSPGQGLASGAVYFAGSADGTCINYSNPVTVEIYSAPTGLNFQGVCKGTAESATIADLVLSGNNIRWYEQSEGGTPLASTDIVFHNTMYYASQTNPHTGCETSRLAVLVNVIVVPVPEGPPIQYFCNDPANPPRVANLTPNGTGYRWYSSALSAIPLSSSTLLVHGQTYYATSYDPPCESTSRLEVLVQFVSPNNAGQDGILEVCSNALSGSVNLFSGLTGTPQTSGEWTGPFAVSGDHLGTLDITQLTLEGSPYVFTYTVTSENCVPSVAEVVVNVLPLPQATVSPNSLICEGESATIHFTGTPFGVILFTINNGVEQSITLDASGSAAYTQPYTTTSIIRLISMSSAASGVICSVDLNDEITVEVIDLPEVTYVAPTHFCEGEAAVIQFTGTPNSVLHYTLNGQVFAVTLNAAGEYELAINSATSSLEIVLTSLDSATTPVCTLLLNETISISMIDKPEATITGNTTICPDESATIFFTGTPLAVVRFELSTGEIIELSLDASGQGQYTASFNQTITATLVEVYTTQPQECESLLNQTITINVIELPFLQEMVDHFTCPGDQVVVPLVGTPNAIVSYTVNNGAVQTVALDASGNGVLTFSPNTTAVISFIGVQGQDVVNCSAPLDFEVELLVAPLPTASWSFEPAVCELDQAVFTFTGTPNATVEFTFAGTNYQVVLDASGTAVWQIPVTETTTAILLSVTAAEIPNCTVVINEAVQVEVLPLPVVSIQADQTICSGEDATFTLTGTPNAEVTYQIGSLPIQTVTLPASGVLELTQAFQTTTTITVLTVAYTSEPGCEQLVNASITITVLELPEANISQDQTICLGESAAVLVTGTPLATVTIQYGTDAPQTFTLDASGQLELTPVFDQTTTVTLVQVQAADGLNCVVTLNQTIEVVVRELPLAVISSSQIVCNSYAIELQITGSPGAVVVYQVDDTAEQTIVIPASGTYLLTVTPTATTIVRLVSVSWADEPSCTQTALNEITLTVLPMPEVTMALLNPICEQELGQVQFNGPANTQVSFTVNGVATTVVLDENGQAIWSGIINSETTLVLQTALLLEAPNCEQPLTGQLVITPIPLPTASISVAPAQVCFNQPVTITIIGTANATVTYLINGVAHSATLDAAGFYSTAVNLAADSSIVLETVTALGCTSTLNQEVEITVLPELFLTVPENLSLCHGENGVINLVGTPQAIISYSVNGGAIQTIQLNAAGTATISQVFTTTTTFIFSGIELASGTNCTATINEVVVVQVQLPPVASISLNGQLPICQDDTIAIQFTGTANAVVTYLVNGVQQTITLDATGQATLNNAYTTNTTITLVSVATTTQPSCELPATGVIVISVVARPNAGQDVESLIVCEQAPAIDLFTYLGVEAMPNGTWSPALASGTGVFNPALDAAGTYTYTVPGVGPCPEDSATITVNLVPEVNAGEDNTIEVCSYEAAFSLFDLLGPTAQLGGVWSPALENGMFNPQVNLSGVYTYTLAAIEGCDEDSATVTVTVIEGLNAGDDASIELCVSSTPIDLFTLLGPDAQLGGVWSPALASGTGVFDPAIDTAGVYIYQSALTDECSNDQAAVAVTIVDEPNAGIDSTAILCSNDAPQDLFDLLEGTPDQGGVWSPALASGTGVFDPAIDTAGVYTYTIDTPYCGSASATVSVQVGEAPFAGEDGTFIACTNSTSVDLFQGLSGDYLPNGVWASLDPTIVLTGATFNPTDLPTGTYTFTYTVDGGIYPCEIDTATVTVEITDPLTSGTFTGIVSFCATTEATPFDLFTLLEQADLGGVWTAAGNEISANIDLSTLAAGLHTFIYTVSSSCGDESTAVQININPTVNSADLTLAINSPVCANDALTGSITGLTTGNYSIEFTLTDATGTVTVITQDVLVNATTAAFTLPGMPSGEYTVAITQITSTATLCESEIQGVEATVVVAEIPELGEWEATANSICLGDDLTVQLTGLTALADGNYNINYTIDGTTYNAMIALVSGQSTWTIPANQLTASGEIALVLVDFAHTELSCMQVQVSRTITAIINQAIDFNGIVLSMDAVCLGEDALVDFTGSAALPYGLYQINYTLNGQEPLTAEIALENGQGTFVLPATALTAAGDYNLTIVSIDVIEAPDCGLVEAIYPSITFTVYEVGTPVINEGGNLFCETDGPTIADLSANMAAGQDVNWYSSPTATEPLNPGTLLEHMQTYYGSLTNEHGCTSLVRLEVIVDLSHCFEITIPDGFSPNNDGINEEFEIRNLVELYPNYSIEIYNRYGNILFKGNVQTGFWNGTVNQSGPNLGSGIVPSGVYFYILNFNDGQREPIQGRVYLNK